jgi:DNA-binding IscR family transcriptional regulator
VTLDQGLILGRVVPGIQRGKVRKRDDHHTGRKLGVGGGYRFAGNPRRLALMDVIRLFEEPVQASTSVASPADTTPVDRALDAVLSEIDRMASATFSSIALATMLRLVAGQSPAVRG